MVCVFIVEKIANFIYFQQLGGFEYLQSDPVIVSIHTQVQIGIRFFPSVIGSGYSPSQTGSETLFFI